MCEDFNSGQSCDNVDHQIPGSHGASSRDGDNIRSFETAAKRFAEHSGIIGNNIESERLCSAGADERREGVTVGVTNLAQIRFPVYRNHFITGRYNGNPRLPVNADFRVMSS